MTCTTTIGTFSYDPIRIDWDTGYIEVVPPMFFDEASPKKMRQIIKLSKNSDSGFIFKVGTGKPVETNSIWLWKQAIRACRERLPKLNEKIDAEKDREREHVENLLKNETNAKKIRGFKSRITEIERSRTYQHKRVKAYSGKLDRFEKLLVDMTAKE